MSTVTLANSRLTEQNASRLNSVARHPTASVLVIMFALVWAGLAPGALASQGLISFRLPLFVEFLVGWAPAIAAILVTAIIEGRKGVGALLGRFLVVRVGIQWYVLALFGMAVMMLGGVALYVFLGAPMPIIPVMGVPVTTAVVAFVLPLALGFIFNTEEIAWRGFILPRLQARHSALAASLLIAVPETLLHLPYFFNKEVHFYQSIGFLGFTGFSFALAILFTWVFNSTRGSLMIVTLAHASQNAWSNLLSDNQPAPFYLTVALLAIAAVVVVIVFGAAHLSRQSTS